MSYTRVADLTVDELKGLIREVVSQTIYEILDPDAGLELHEEVRERLQRSLAAVQAGKETISADQVAADLGLEW